MKLVLICGAWGSGTSVVTGALVRMGYHAPGPFFWSNDPRTPNTYECLPFIELVRKLVSGTTLELSVPSRDVVIEELAAFKENVLCNACRQRGVSDDGPVVLKHPLSAVILNEITQVFDTRLIVVLRPLDQIEETRRRRNWSSVYGEAGAKARLYAHLQPHRDARHARDGREVQRAAEAPAGLPRGHGTIHPPRPLGGPQGGCPVLHRRAALRKARRCRLAPEGAHI